MWNEMMILSVFVMLNAGVGVAAEILSAEIVVLTQTACQFVESEHVEHHFNSHSADQCKRLNAQTAAQRLQNATVLKLKAGDYVFRVQNRDVSYDLGFWLRGSGFARLSLPSVSGGGIAKGQQRDYAITLEPGEYRYSCPLNPTPDYTLIVE